MRRDPNGAGPGQGPLGWLILAAICVLLVGIGVSCRGSRRAAYADETDVPNDSFAVSASTGVQTNESAEPAEPTMMLKIACLTFDDGPSKNTDEILKILKQYNVPATFFVTNQEANQEYLPKVAQIAADGHQIALHSSSHQYSKIYASSSAFWMDIKELRQALEPYVDADVIHWLRFPGGSTNTVSHKYGGSGIMKQLKAEAKEKGYEWIDWNVCGGDATSARPDAAGILRNIRRDAQGRDICVVLLHDTKATGQTVKALPDIIEWFESEGYQFCTVEQMYEARDGG